MSHQETMRILLRHPPWFVYRRPTRAGDDARFFTPPLLPAAGVSYCRHVRIADRRSRAQTAPPGAPSGPGASLLAAHGGGLRRLGPTVRAVSRPPPPGRAGSARYATFLRRWPSAGSSARAARRRRSARSCSSTGRCWRPDLAWPGVIVRAKQPTPSPGSALARGGAGTPWSAAGQPRMVACCSMAAGFGCWKRSSSG